MADYRTINGWKFRQYGTLKDYDFDYLRAMLELGWPAYQCLPADLRALAEDTCVVAEKLTQNTSLLMPWPFIDGEVELGPDTSFRTRFEKAPAEWLAQASAAVHGFGHWFAQPVLVSSVLKDARGQPLEIPAPDWMLTGRLLQSSGGYWKFANYADQVLRAKCQLSYRPNYGVRGCRFEVHEGMLRLCLTYKSRREGEGWTWKAVCLATVERLNVMRAALRSAVPNLCPDMNDPAPEMSIETYAVWEQAVAALELRRNDFESRWLDKKAYMGPQKGGEYAAPL